MGDATEEQRADIFNRDVRRPAAVSTNCRFAFGSRQGAAAGRAGCDAPQKTEGAANLRSLLRGLYPPPGTCQNDAYWLSGLNTRMPASVFEQAPKGSTRTTPSSSAQKPRIPVWLIVIGTPRAV